MPEQMGRLISVTTKAGLASKDGVRYGVLRSELREVPVGQCSVVAALFAKLLFVNVNENTLPVEMQTAECGIVALGHDYLDVIIDS
jgi:hypothetical protein